MKECASSSSTMVVLLSSPPLFSAPPSNEDAGRVDDEDLPVDGSVVDDENCRHHIVIGEVSNNGFGTDFKGRP